MTIRTTVSVRPRTNDILCPPGFEAAVYRNSRSRSDSQPKQFLRVARQQLSLHFFAGSEPPDRRDDTGAQAFRSPWVAVVAVASEEQLVLMAREKVAREFLVARQRAEPGACGQIAEHV